VGQAPQFVGHIYFCIVGGMKDIVFVGSSIDDLRDFPQGARQRVGYQLHVVQQGDDPLDWKPMPAVGAGCREIRIRDANEAHRVFYVATFGDCVYVLHCFEKKSQRTAKADIDLGKQRYRQMKSLIDARETP
jgi:phage-related protein